MEVFECTGCKYRTNVKCNYIRHKSSEKHKKSEEKKNAKKGDQTIKELRCRYCTQLFSCKQSLNRHENHRCKHKTPSQELIQLQSEVKDLQTLVKLLHLQLSQKDVLLDIKNDLIEKLQKYNELKIN